MSRGLGYAAYRAMSWRQPEANIATARPRPPGQLLWAHAATADRVPTLCDLTARVRNQRPGLHVLITTGEGKAETAPAPGAPPMVPLVSDHPSSMRRFLDHWRPDLCLWAGGGLMPNLTTMAHARGMAMLLADFGDADLPSGRLRWLPDLTRTCLECFDPIMATSEAAAQQLRRIGIAGSRVHTASRLRSGASPPACSDMLLSDATEALSARPVWLAVEVLADEAPGVIRAHHKALRMLHRLLLVIVPRGPEDYARVTQHLDAAALRYADWSPGDEIDENTQVLISCNPDALGLWYRVAPLSFLGSSLVAGEGGCNPLDAAALGSAILYGPHVRDHLDAFARLTAEGAARVVRGAEGLSAAVVRLIAPDEAAAMALAGWQVVTEGAHLTDMLADTIQDRLDQVEARDARA